MNFISDISEKDHRLLWVSLGFFHPVQRNIGKVSSKMWHVFPSLQNHQQVFFGFWTLWWLSVFQTQMLVENTKAFCFHVAVGNGFLMEQTWMAVAFNS